MGESRRKLRDLRELANENWTPGEVTLPPDGPLFLAAAVKTAQDVLKYDRAHLTAAVQGFRATPDDWLSEANAMARLNVALEYIEAASTVIRAAQGRWRIASARLELVERDR